MFVCPKEAIIKKSGDLCIVSSRALEWGTHVCCWCRRMGPLMEPVIMGKQNRATADERRQLSLPAPALSKRS